MVSISVAGRHPTKKTSPLARRLRAGGVVRDGLPRPGEGEVTSDGFDIDRNLRDHVH